MAFDKDHDGLKREFSHNLQAFGQNGFKVIVNNSVVGDFVAFTTIEDSLVSVTIPDNMPADAISNTQIPAGITIYGKFTSITTAPGKVIAYILTEG